MSKKSKTLTAAVAAALVASLSWAPAAHAGSGEIVHTDKGTVRGTVTGGTRTFGNIPFAAPPVGENRWRDPRPVTPWHGVRDATVPSPVCAQNAQLGTPASETEDCLYLTVTTPATASRTPRPVMVWVHGGGFTSGSGRLYDARRLAQRTGSVVVTVNYRLGVFGFFGYPGLPGSGTFGLADQQAALHWVQRNARAFGGDARNVTLFGESAGGLSVCAQLASPAAAGLFHKAVIQSGACGLTTPDPQRPGEFLTLWKPRTEIERTGAAQPLGCADLACLRGLSVQELLPSHVLFPYPAFDTRVLPVDPAVAQATGRVHRVPTMVGSTHDEGTLFAALYLPTPIPEQAHRATIAAAFGETHADAIAARYPVNGNGDARDEFAAALTDHSWACPTHDTRRQLGRVTRVSGYEFADRDVPLIFPGLPEMPGGYGAYHGSELTMLFDLGVTLTPAQRRLGDHMIDAWGRFARTGDPGWHAEVQSLAPGAVGGTDFARDHRCAFWSSLGR
ncbi:para-nitrobenzyl esterase [Lentzea fradiae]|uniref:Carboxylic ester hydrolase n=1 Tax=Lentzea fradiae TaxID=200378 RepID=A0A1G7W5D0_9PSEU|nr:carboxylesterase family protein [Lentzea fradiae]SDG67138.1 para-nitrobenzyl esterase [Lentzea fradiae]